MKFFAYLALVGAASSYNLADMEDASQDLLTIKMNDWAGRRINRKHRALEDAWENITHPRFGPNEREAAMRHKMDDFEYIFGESVEDMNNRIKPKERYLPDLGAWWNSKEVADVFDFNADYLENDPKFRKMYAEAMKLNKDLFGGCGRGGCKRGLLDNGDEIRERPGDDLPNEER